MTTIVSIQSQVMSGYVGNAAAVPQMRAAGFTVAAVPTVLFSNHPGHGRFRGAALDPDLVHELLLGIEEHGVLDSTRVIVSGYLGTAATGRVVADFVDRARARHPGIVYLCDPVMGDTGSGPFVPEEVVAVIRDELVPRAQVVTPNQFEAGLLGVADVGTVEGLATLLTPELRGAVVTGCLLTDTADDTIESVVLEAGGTTRVVSARVPGAPNGTGDLFNGALAAALAAGHPLPLATRSAADAVSRALRHSIDQGSVDLVLP